MCAKVYITSTKSTFDTERFLKELENQSGSLTINEEEPKVTYTGWTCPKCGRVLSPWTPQCPCSSSSYPPREPINTKNTFGFTYKCCQNCNNNPANNPYATGICNCALPYFEEISSSIDLGKSNFNLTF